MNNQRGAALIEMGILISMVVLVTVLSVRQLSWKVSCNVGVAAYALSVVNRGPPDSFGVQFRVGYFGRFPMDYNAWPEAYVIENICNGDMDSGFVRFFRNQSGL